MDYQETAAKWRSKQSETRANTGVVLIWEGKVYGWKNELRDPGDEKPGAIAVDVAGAAWKAQGGNNHDGAERWEPLTQAI